MAWVEISEEQRVQSRRLNEAIAQVLGALPSVHTVDPVVTRAQRSSGGGPFPAPVMLEAGEDRTIQGPAGSIALRIFRSEPSDAAYLHLHGGGWVFGAAGQQDLLLQTLSSRANVTVISVDYRLAPEHPFPAGPDDCEAAALWLVENATREFGTRRLLIGGESAGAHLSALTLLRLRDRHQAAAFCGANLVFGAYDLGMTPSQRLWGERNLILSTPIIQWFCDLFLPGTTSEERRDPARSPLYADLRGLPPALFMVGELDPLLDDSLFMAARWQAAGNRSDLLVYPESIHGFHAFPTEIAAMAIQAQVDFVRRCVERDGGSAPM